MAKKPVKKKCDFKPYPKEDNLRVGCKVSWNYYAKKEDAEAASVAAKHNAVICAELGYDFGYCSPGSIRLIDKKDWPEYGGLYEVCLP